jgi:hypothetical protein
MKLRKLIFDFLAVFLILSNPYLEFAHQHRFMFEVTNLLVLSVYVVVALTIAALLTKYPNRLLGSVLFTASIIIFLDLRLDLINSQGFQILYVVIPALVIFWITGRNTSKILFAFFGVMLIVGLLPPAFPRTHKADTLQVANQPGENLPVYVHIILDEQIGVEGIGAEIRGHKEAKNALKEFFIPNGFRLFGRAYSEFYWTNDSIPSMLNFTADENPKRFYNYNKVQDRNVVLENKYFTSLFNMGYKIRVYQMVWMDYCKGSNELIDFCLTYKASGVSKQALENLDHDEILDVRLTVFWKKSFIKEKLRTMYSNVSSVIERIGLPMPDWVRLDHKELGPIPALPVFDTLINDVPQAEPGTMFFAHLVIPHFPYAVGSDCSIRRPVFSWKRFTPSPPLTGELQNTFESRQERYDDYFEQTNCALTKLSELVERMKARGIYDNATIVVHGDHGSRIGLIVPNIENSNSLPPREFYDGFSTLLAVKAPQFTAGYDLTMLPVTRLLRQIAKEQPGIPEKTDGHFVYIRDNQDSIRSRVPMPDIPGADLPGLN